MRKNAKMWLPRVMKGSHSNDVSGDKAMNRLDGKTALITGGGRGQGAAEAELFVKAGAQVMITDIDTAAGQDVASRFIALSPKP